MLQDKMDEIYKISSTERVQQAEKELAVQLTELKTEMEGNGILQGTPHCSVPLPKDVDYFRREREWILKKCLQVAEAKPLVIQTDVLQRELDSCLKREYTPESLPLLLYQFFIDRIPQLVQSKYLYMLRWKRFCQHSSIIEQLYPFYQKQVAQIMQEYNDAVQRAARLSSVRESFLTGKEIPINLVTQEDLMIYTQWLICHLHSLKTIHAYLQVLQHLPISHRTEVAIDRHPFQGDGHKTKASGKMDFLSSRMQVSVHPSSSAIEGTIAKNALPQHTAEIDQLKPQLRLLLSQLNINYDVENLKHSVNEMKLFSMLNQQDFPQHPQVKHKFRSIFSKQQTMRTFPVYDAGTPGSDKLGMMSSNVTLKKKANWTSFIKIKPRHDPWQQKLLIKLKQWKKVDEQLQIQSKLLQVSNLEYVMEGLQEQAVAMLEPPSMASAFMTSFHSKHYSQIWEKLYRNPEFYQGQKTNDNSNNLIVAIDEKSMENVNFKEGSVFSGKRKHGSELTASELLGLDEDLDAPSKDLSMRKGGYLSVLYLRHLRIRELQRICLGILNYFRSIERTLTISTSGLASCSGHLIATAEDASWVNAAKGGTGAFGGQKAGPDCSSNSYSRWAQTSVDRSAVLLDLWTCEADFLKNKWQLLDSYFEVYQHALDSEERFALAQVITNIIYRRPRFDFHLEYFVNTYRNECTCLKLHLCLVRDIMNRQIENQRKYNYKIWRGGPKGCISEFGFPPYIVTKQLIALSNSPTALKNMYLLEFHSSLGLVSLIPKALDCILQEFQQICRPNTASEAIHLEEQILQLSLDGWMTMENPESFYATQIQRDIFADVMVEDPLIIREIVTSALKSASEEEQRSSKEKQTITLNVFSRLLELLTLRHRLIEAAVEGAQLGRLYKEFAEEMGFNGFHLYLRPVYFECATHKEKADQLSPIFIASLLEDHDINVDRYIPSSLMLEIQDIDNQIRKFSFSTRESILQLLLKHYGMENLQIALACQVTHKNMLLVAVQQAAFCPSVQPMLTGDLKTYRSFCFNSAGETGSTLNHRMSQYSLRSQIIAYYNSIKAMLDDFPRLKNKYFTIGLPQEKKDEKESKEKVNSDPRSFQPRPRSLLSSDGQSFLNLWFIPHPSETLTAFKMLPEKIGCSALRHSLQIVAPFHDIIAYIFSFAQLGSAPGCFNYRCPSERLTADWGGTEQIGIELLEIQKKIDSLPNSSDPKKVSQMLTMLKEVKFLQFEAAVRYSMRHIWKLCLCSLSTEDQKVAHGELIGIQFVMEDVLWNSEILTDHQEVQKPFRNVKQVSTSTAEAKRKALTAPPDTMTSYALQRSYLIRWKQLEMLKAEWGRLKLKVEDINTVPLYKQFSELYEAEILRAAMRSIARHWGIEDEFEEYGTIPPCSFFPREVSKIDIITHQFQKLLESLEMHMIHDVQKKINKEITLVLSEKAREERHLPTACDVMARERSNYETYSMFYENLLRQQHQLLYQKEQEMHVIEANTETVDVDLSQIARLSHEMILEITALRAKLTDLQRDDHTTKEKIRKEVQEDYEALVQNIFWVCLQIKGKVDEYRLSMNKQMLEIISEVRKEGVEKIINLKKKYGSTKDNSALEEHLAQGKLQELRDENSELEKLLCKLKALKFWKETMQKAQFLTTLQGVEKEAIQNKNECLQSQMKAEEEAVLFNHQLRAVKKVLTESQTENKKLKQQLEKQEYLLQKAERKINQEFCKRQQLDLIKTANMEKMLENLGEREVTLLNPTEESEKSSKTRHLQEAKMKKEIQQIRSQLTQERNLKLNAFQRIQELQCQLYDSEAAISQNRSPAGINVV
ncbi:hypothetical protein Chor_006772 [Crotalus horridus]